MSHFQGWVLAVGLDLFGTGVTVGQVHPLPLLSQDEVFCCRLSCQTSQGVELFNLLHPGSGADPKSHF